MANPQERQVTFRVATGSLNPLSVKVEIEISSGHTIEEKCFKTAADVWYTLGQIILSKATLRYRYKFEVSNRSFKHLYKKKFIEYVENEYRPLLPSVNNYRDILEPPHTTLSATDVYPGLHDHLRRLFGTCRLGTDIYTPVLRELEHLWPNVARGILSEPSTSSKIKEWTLSTIGLYASLRNKDIFTCVACVIYGKLSELIPVSLEDAQPAVTRGDCKRIIDMLRNIDLNILTNWSKPALQIAAKHSLQVTDQSHWLYAAAYFPHLFTHNDLEKSRREVTRCPDLFILEKTLIPQIAANYNKDDAVKILRDIPDCVKNSDKAKITEMITSYTSAMQEAKKAPPSYVQTSLAEEPTTGKGNLDEGVNKGNTSGREGEDATVHVLLTSQKLAKDAKISTEQTKEIDSSTKHSSSTQQTDSSTQHASIKPEDSSAQHSSTQQTDSLTQHSSTQQTDSSAQHKSTQQADSSTQHSSDQQTDSSTQHSSTQQTDSLVQYKLTQQADSSTQHSSTQQADSSTQHSSDQQTDSSTQHSSTQQTDSSVQYKSTQPADSSTQHSSTQQADSSTQHSSNQQTDSSTQHSSTQQTDSSVKYKSTQQADSPTQRSSDQQMDSSTQNASTQQTDSSIQHSSDQQADPLAHHKSTHQTDSAPTHNCQGVAKTDVKFHVLVRAKDVTHVKLIMRTVDQQTTVSKHDMSWNIVRTEGNWVHAMTTLPMSLDKQYRYRYSMMKTTVGWLSQDSSTIEERLERSFTTNNSIYDTFQFPDMSKSTETVRIAKRLYLAIFMTSVKSANFKESIIQMEKIGFPGNNDKLLINETCEWIHKTIRLKRTATVSLLTNVQLAFLAVVLAKVVRSASAYSIGYEKWITVDIFNQIVSALQSFAADEFPKSVKDEELEYLCIFTINSINGNWLHVWLHYFKLLSLQTIDRLRKFIDMPKLIWNTWGDDRARITDIIKRLGKNNEAFEILFHGLVDHAKDTRVLNDLLQLYQQCATDHHETNAVVNTAAVKLRDLIESKKWTRQLNRLVEIWQMVLQTSATVAESARIYVVKYLAHDNFRQSDAGLLGQIILNEALYKTSDEINMVMNNLLKHQNMDIFQNIFVEFLECSFLMKQLHPKQIQTLLLQAIQLCRPSAYQSNPRKQPDAIRRLYRIVGVTCRCKYLDIENLREDVKTLAYKANKSVLLETLLKALSPEKAKLLRTEEITCLSEHIQQRLREDKTTKVNDYHLRHLRESSEKPLSVNSKQIRDVILAMLDTQEPSISKQECEKSVIKLEGVVANILQNGPFWRLVFESTGVYSKDLELHSSSKAVTDILRQEFEMIRIGSVTPAFLKTLKKPGTKPFLDLMAVTSPTYQGDIKQWEHDQKRLTEMEKTFNERIDCLRTLFDGCLHRLQGVQVKDIKTLAKQLRKCVNDFETKTCVTLRETTEAEYWGALYDLFSVANKLHGLAFSTVFLNICHSVLNCTCPIIPSTSATDAQEEQAHPVHGEASDQGIQVGDIVADEVLKAVSRSEPITTNDLASVVMQHCLPVFSQHCKVFLMGNLSISVDVINNMVKGIRDEKVLREEIQKIENFFDCKVPSNMKFALKGLVELTLLRRRSEQLAAIFGNFNIPDEGDDIHNALTKINELSMGDVTLQELDKALKTVAVIETSFQEEEWEIVEQLARSKELVSFLRTIIEEDLRNLIDAVEERSEQSVDEAIVSDLIDVQRYMKPLLGAQTRKRLVKAIAGNRKLAQSVKKMPHKLDACVSNVHSLKDLYNNVANRGEMTKEIVSNALQCGLYSFKMDESSDVCRVVLSYKRVSSDSRYGTSDARYGLDELNDLRSRALLLVNSRKDAQQLHRPTNNSSSPTPNLREFATCVTTVNDIVDLCSRLVNSGHFHFNDYLEDVKGLPQLERLRDVLKRKYDHWRSILDEARRKYYFLNFFHSKRLLKLDQFFTRKCSMTNDIRLLFRYINSSVDADDSLRQVYEIPKDKGDLQARLFHLGAALQEVFGQYQPIARRIPGEIPVQKSTVNTQVYRGKVFVAVLDEQSKKSIPVMLSLYNNTTGLIPEPSQVIFCQSDTSWEEVDLFLRRCIGASNHFSKNNLYTLVNVDLLPLETQFQLVKQITQIQKSDNQDYLLAMICRGGNNHHIIDQFSPHFTHRIHGFTDAEMKICFNTGWPNVEIVTSCQAGLGKSEYVKNKASSNAFGVSTLTVSGPMTKPDLVKRVQLQQIRTFEMLHIDVAPVSDPYLLDCFLFELLVMGMAVSGTHMCMTQTSNVAVEIANTQADTLRNALTTSCMFQGKLLRWKGFQDLVVSVDINSPVQVVCRYLQLLDSHTLDSNDIVLTGPNRIVQPLPATVCIELLRKHIGNLEGLTFTIVDTFLGIFAQELSRMSASLYFTTQNLKDMLGTNDVRSQLLKAVLDVSMEFSSPSVHTGQTESKQESSVSVSGYRQSSSVTASQMVERLHGMVKWADSNHLLVVFHRQDSQTISPLFRLKSQVPTHITKLFQYQMKRDLSDYKNMTQAELQSTLEKIVRSTRKKFDQANLKELQTNYALTPDNLLKMVLIHMRINSRIPVIVMGETGCGKTTLITYLARVCEVPFSTLNLHAGVTQESILNFIESLQTMAENNLKQEVWGFLDEINTCDHLGLLNEVICRRSCRGKLLPHNLVFIAACNPYRLRTDSTLSAGLEGAIQHDELSRLVYRVHPLPESMMDYVWDFGSLDRKDEEAYIKRMLETQDSILVDMIIMSQVFMRETEKTSYCVSLRDVNRCQYLCQWFEQMLQFKGIAQAQVNDQLTNNVKTRSMILALAHCYHSRLTKEEDRRKYRTNIAIIFTHRFYNIYEEDIERMIRAEQLDLLNRMQLLPGTAKNAALRENVFVILVSIMNRLPVFVVGKPGCSKSLSMQLIKSNLRGADSRDNFFKTLPPVYVVSHQGSESSTSDGIIKVFEKAKNYKKANPDVMPVVLLDEIGLAEASSYNPLKVLHSQLEPTVGGFPPIAVVGISNWALDAAKMNRAIHLSRPEPTAKDLADTAMSIRDDCEANKSGGIIPYNPVDDDKLKRLATAYSDYQMNQAHKNFHGLRDYYSLVKYVTTQCVEQMHNEPEDIIQTGLLRNFGGLKLEMNHILKKFSVGDDNIFYNLEVHPSVRDLIKSNLDDTLARHLMLITSGDSALNILEQTLQGRNYVTIFGSKFEQDISEDYNYRILSEIILCMERGNTLILRDLDSIYGSLYDMLNQNYTVVGKKRSCRVAHGAYSNPMCQVHETFRCVVLVDEHNVDYQNPPFLNRFEKQTLRFADVLDSEQKKVIEYLDKWKDDISFIEGHNFSPDEMFLGFHDDTLPSLVCSYRSRSKDLEPDTELVTRCIADLMKVACPDAVLRISKSKWGKEHPTEVEEFERRYFSQPHFSGLNYFLESYLAQADAGEIGNAEYTGEEQSQEKLENNCSRLVVYTHSSVHTDVTRCVEGSFNPQVEKLSNFKSERHLSAKLRLFWLESKKDLLIIQCMASVDSENLLLTKCKMDEYRQEYLTSVGPEGMCKHACIIVHIDREDIRQQSTSTWQFNFLCGWQQFTLDTLESCTPLLLDLLEETVSSHLSNGTVQLEVIIEELILWCFSCIKYDSHFREVGDVVSLASDIAQSQLLKAYLRKQVLKYIQGKEALSIHECDEVQDPWQVRVACDRYLLFRCSSLVGSMLEHINNYVKQPLVKCVVLLEMHNAWAGSPISNDVDDEMAEFWQACFDHSGVFDINSNVLPAKIEIESCIVECKYLKLKFPFFNAFHSKIEEHHAWLITQDNTRDANVEDPESRTTTLSEQLNDIINNMDAFQYGEYVHTHVKDFCDDLFNTYSFEYAPHMLCDTRLEVMKYFLTKLGLLIDLVPGVDPIHHIANVYATLWVHEQLLRAKVQLIAIYSGVSGTETHELLGIIESKQLCDKAVEMNEASADDTHDNDNVKDENKTNQTNTLADNDLTLDDHSVMDSKDTDEVLVTEICKSMLPSEDTLLRVGGIDKWQQQASLLLILAGKVCDESGILHFLRLCLEFVSRLSNNFNIGEEQVVELVNLVNGSDDPLESEDVFNFIVTTIHQLQNEEHNRQQSQELEEFLGIYFGLCLEVNVDSPLRPRIMQGLCNASGDLIVGSRPVLLALLQSDINMEEQEDNSVPVQLIREGQLEEGECPNLAFIDEILQKNRTDCHLAALCCDIIEEIAFKHITSAKLGAIVSEDHHILLTANEAVHYIQSSEHACCLRLIVSTAYVRAFIKATAELLHGKTMRSFKKENIVFANVLNGLLRIKDETVPDLDNTQSSIKLRLLKCLREHKAMGQLQKWCEEMTDPLTSMQGMKWQTVLLSSNLGYNPLAYVNGFADVVNAIKTMQNNHDKQDMEHIIELARNNQKARIALLAAIAEMFYFIQTTGGSRVSAKDDIQWIYDQTVGYPMVFRKFLKRLLGLVDFSGIMRIGESTKQEELEMVSVVIHFMSIVVACAGEIEHPVFLNIMTNAVHGIYLPCIGQTSSCFSTTQDIHLKTSVCPCGIVLVKHKQIVAGRCPVCARKTKDEDFSLDDKSISAPDMPDVEGYTFRHTEANITERLRDMSPAAFRIMRVLLHCCLLGGKSTGCLTEEELITLCALEEGNESSTSEVDRGGADGESTVQSELGVMETSLTETNLVQMHRKPSDSIIESYLTSKLEEDWRLLQDAVFSDSESVTLLIHSVIRKSEDHIRSTNPFGTAQERNQWEKLVSERINEQVQALPHGRSQFKRICLNAQGVPQSCLETQIEELDSTNTTCLRRLLRNTGNQSFTDFQARFIAKAARYPFLRIYFRHHERLQFVRHLPALLNWNKHIINTVNHKIKRTDAKQTKVAEFLCHDRFHQDEATKNAANDVFERFQEAWNKVREGWSIIRGEKAQFDRISGDSLISDCIVDACAKQNNLREMMKVLQAIQNEFIMETMAVTCSEYCPALSFLMYDDKVAGQNHAHLNHAKGGIIDYEWSDDELVFRDINTEYGSGTDIGYNFGIIEDKLARKLILNKVILTDGETFTQFAFSDDLSHACSTILAEINQWIRQEQLSQDLINIIKSEQERRQTFAKGLLEHLEVILVLLKKAKGRSESSIEDFIKRWSTHLPGSFPPDLLPEPKDSFKLHHIVHLYEVLEDQLVDVVDLTLNDSFREEIPDQVEREFNARLKPCAIEKLESVSSLIRRFLFRYLRSVVDVTIHRRSLSQLMERHAGSTMDCSATSELLPHELTVANVVKILEVLKKHAAIQREANRKKRMPSSSTRSQKGQTGKKRRGGIMQMK